jgi:hypothetical protein
MEKHYLNPSDPGSFGGVARLKASTSTARKEVENFLSSQATYTRHKQRYGKFPRRKVTSPYRNYVWQADLVFMEKYKRQNSGHKYLLTVIDVFSRYGFVVPLKNKTAFEIIRGFKIIFKLSNGIPKQLQTDEGLEFFNRHFQSFLKNYDIKLYHNFSDFKACVVERFNRSILMRIARYFTFSGGYRYIDVLPAIVESYNNSVHRSIGVKPCDVNSHNEMDVWLRSNSSLYTKTYQKSKFKLNDRVRFAKKRETFEKGYAPSYTEEIFEIAEILNTVPVTFRIRELNGEILSGIFYNQELIKVPN